MRSGGEAVEPTKDKPAAGRGRGALKRVVAPALVGRADELELLASTISEPPAVVVVEGEAGVGKTRLVSELLTRPEVSDRRLLMGICRRIREPFPLGPLVEAVRGAGDDLRAASLSPVAGALRPLLPELADLLPAQPAALEDRAAERHRVFRGLVEVFGSLGPVVVVLEDVHWVDEHSVEFLGYLLNDPAPELSLVLTFRGDDVHPEVRTLTAKLPESLRRAQVVLAPLDEQQTGALAASVLGVDRVSEEFAAYLCERTGGLPFAVEELLALLQARGKLKPRGSGWARRTLDELDVPTGIRDQVLERVSRLSADARAVVEAAAVLQTPVPVEVLVATAVVPSARARRGLGESLESGVLVESAGQVGLRHLLAAQAVYESIPTPRREDLHSRAVAALEALDSPPLGQVAYHLQQAGRVDEWVQAAEKAADQAVGLGPDEEAARLLDDVLRHVSLDAEQKVLLAVKLGQAAEGTRHSAAALDTLLSVLKEQPVPSGIRGELQFWLAMMLDATDQDRHLEFQMYRAAAEELDPGQVELRTRAMLGLANPTRAPGVSLADHKMWLSRAITILPTGGGDSESFLLGKAAMVSVAMGDYVWRELAARITMGSGESAHQRYSVSAYGSAGYAALYAGHHEIADQLLTAGTAGFSELGRRRVELKYRSMFASLGYCRGTWDGLDEEIETLLDSLVGYPSSHIDVELVAGCLALAHGNLAEAKSRLTRVMDEAENLAGLDILPVAVVARVRLNLSSGDVNSALSAADQLLGLLEIKGMWAPIARALPAITQAKVEGEQLPDARVLVERIADELDGLDVPLGPPSLRHAHGFIEAGAKHWSAAAEQFVAAGELYDPLQCPYEAAQAREQAAVCLFEDGDRGADEALAAAMATYQQLGATWDWGRAAGVARQHGVEVPRPWRGGRRGYGNELSPRELQVAELAAIGRTNKEIAQELYLSPKTVEVHLKAVRRKLGVRSRAAIGRRLTEASADVHVKNTQFT